MNIPENPLDKLIIPTENRQVTQPKVLKPTAEKKRSPKIYKNLIKAAAGLAIVALGIHEVIKADDRGNKLQNEKAYESALLNKQINGHSKCLNGYIELMPGDIFRSMPESIDPASGHGLLEDISLSGAIPVLSNFAADTAGDAHKLAPGQALVISDPIVVKVKGTTWDEFSIVKQSQVVSNPPLKPETVSEMAGQIDWVNYSALITQNTTGSLEHTYYRTPVLSDRLVNCQLNPTSPEIYTSTGQQAGVAYMTNPTSFQADRKTILP
ncbi:MAG TPA: hypothetical protein VFN51_03270 [Candidatus Saccharimonadales bacterium]|nr:hypothetical protein [Candidatus Saccharimonadales bacterium]